MLKSGEEAMPQHLFTECSKCLVQHNLCKKQKLILGGGVRSRCKYRGHMHTPMFGKWNKNKHLLSLCKWYLDSSYLTFPATFMQAAMLSN